MNIWETTMYRTLYPRQTRKEKWFGLRYLFFTGWCFKPAELPINWINMAYQSLEHSTLCNCVKSVAVADLPTRLQLIELQSICFICRPLFASCEWQQWCSQSWWPDIGFKFGLACVRSPLHQCPVGVVAPKTSKQRLPDTPVTQHQLGFRAWHISNTWLSCDCVRWQHTLCVLSATPVSAHKVELLHPTRGFWFWRVGSRTRNYSLCLSSRSSMQLTALHSSLCLSQADFQALKG